MSRALVDYVTPVSVDTFGRYPGKRPGDQFEEMHNGRVYVATVQPGPAHRTPTGAVLRNVRFQQVEGPVMRKFVACPIIAGGKA